jgi:hypothetical protein
MVIAIHIKTVTQVLHGGEKQMGKGFGKVPSSKSKGSFVNTTLTPEETQVVLAEMYDFLECDDNLAILGRMALRRYVNGEGRGAVVAAPWQKTDPDLIPTHYMADRELKEAKLAYPGVMYDFKRYKPHSQFLFIYWKQDIPKTLAACQVISLGIPLVKLFKV